MSVPYFSYLKNYQIFCFLLEPSVNGSFEITTEQTEYRSVAWKRIIISFDGEVTKIGILSAHKVQSGKDEVCMSSLLSISVHIHSPLKITTLVNTEDS